MEINKKNIIGLSLAVFGQTMLISLTSLALPIFFTDVARIDPVQVSSIFLLTKIWDAINDPMMGVFVDRTRTRWGKCRPYILFVAVPLGVLGTLMFVPVGGSDALKFGYALVTYALFITAFTAIDIPLASIKPLLFSSSDKRNKAMSISSTFGALGSFLAIDIFFALVSVLGGGNEKRGYLVTVALLCFIGCSFLLLSFFTMKEVVPISKGKVSFLEAFKMLLKNKPLFILICISVASIAAGSYGMMLPYFAKWNLQDTFNFGTLSVVAIIFPLLNTLNGIIYMATVFVTPFLLKRISKKNLFMVVVIVGLIINVAAYFIGYSNFWVFLIVRALAHIPHGVLGTLVAFMIADTLDLMEYKTGKRTEGVTYSVNNFVAKTGGAVFNAAVLAALGFVGYKIGVLAPALNAGESIDQNFPELTRGIYTIMTLLPIIALALQAIVMPFYKFTDKEHEELVEVLTERRAAMVALENGDDAVLVETVDLSFDELV